LSIDEKINIGELKQSLLEGNIKALSKSITLVESSSYKHFEMAQVLINSIMPQTGKSVRIGITGIPGAGKSTFIESFGLLLLEKGHKVAVLAVDPSSSISRGSILGDKTRMEKLSRHKNCFIRPSPSGGSLGGVANKTRESILICEAAGYDRILVESMGVGQSEVELRTMVDFLLLLLIPGSGDELQGLKKGIVEIADLIAINKSEGENKDRAKLTAIEYSSALKYLNQFTEGWKVKVKMCSAITGEGLMEMLRSLEEFEKFTKSEKIFERNRNEQLSLWMDKIFMENLKRKYLSSPDIKNYRSELKAKVITNELSPSAAAELLMKRIVGD